MISIENARKWATEAYERKQLESLTKWVINIGDDWVQTFKDRMTQSMLTAVHSGKFTASVEISSPVYSTAGEVDKWQDFIRPKLEELLQFYESLGFQDGAFEHWGVAYNIQYTAAYRVGIDWGYRISHMKRVRYA